MSEILLHSGMVMARFLIGLYEFFGVLFEADFLLTNGLFSSTSLVTIRRKISHRAKRYESRHVS